MCIICMELGGVKFPYPVKVAWHRRTTFQNCKHPNRYVRSL